MLREVVGHPGPVRLFARLVAAGRLPHGVIIEGPTGSGRRTLARKLASALLCPERQDGDACGVCQHCVHSRAGTHPDFIELPGRREAPSGLPVDDMREVVDRASSSPLLAVGKVIILPDAERLQGASANALLKLLEEPPPNTWILLTAVSVGGLLGTIRSRAQAFRVQALDRASVERVLVRRGISPGRAAALVAAGAGIDADDSGQMADPPFAELERLLSGLDLAAIVGVLDALESAAGAQRSGRRGGGEDADKADDAEGAGLTPAAIRRGILRVWLTQLALRVQGDLRRQERAGQALDRLDRLAHAQIDLERNQSPRLVLEGLSVVRPPH
jgi:DNA polymerase-3 subunit delta'